MTDRLIFLWEKFIDEDMGAVEQIIAFIEQIAFHEILDPLIGLDNAVHVQTADVDLRMPKEGTSIMPSALERYTIELE